MPSKSRSGNPATRAASSVSDFKSTPVRGDLQTLPSGKTARVRNRGMKAFLRLGVIPNSLLSIIEEALAKGQPPDMEKLKDDNGNLPLATVDDMYTLMDAVAVDCFVEPRVYAVPTQEDLMEYNIVNPEDELERPEDLRKDELLYVDELDDEDKMFIFQWVTGGTRDVARFRRELEADLAAVPGVKNVGGAAKRAPRAAAKRR